MIVGQVWGHARPRSSDIYASCLVEEMSVNESATFSEAGYVGSKSTEGTQNKGKHHRSPILLRQGRRFAGQGFDCGHVVLLDGDADEHLVGVHAVAEFEVEGVEQFALQVLADRAELGGESWQFVEQNCVLLGWSAGGGRSAGGQGLELFELRARWRTGAEAVRGSDATFCGITSGMLTSSATLGAFR
ncbi:hypothetical protein [Nonomuraea fuscirosea]|uniref:hypothetical protein n=1 Tax=Nonomuraea fuscirosea TaxID=1291556 RepID=UPI0033CF991B